MRVPRSIAVLAVAGAVAAVPASAGAGPLSGVKSEVKQANTALKKAKNAALAGRQQAVYRHFAALGEHAGKAEGKARRIKRLAEGRKDRKRSARALTKVAAQYDRDVGAFAGILDQVSPQIQEMIAQGLVLSADAQERLIEMLTRFAEQLPDGARANVLAAIERFETDGDVSALFGALASDDVTDGVKGLISEHIDGVFEHIDGVIDRLAEYDPEAAAQVRETIAMLREQLDGVIGMVEGLLDGLLGGEVGGFPGLGMLPGLDGGGSILDMIGQFLPQGGSFAGN